MAFWTVAAASSIPEMLYVFKTRLLTMLPHAAVHMKHVVVLVNYSITVHVEILYLIDHDTFLNK